MIEMVVRNKTFSFIIIVVIVIMILTEKSRGPEGGPEKGVYVLSTPLKGDSMKGTAEGGSPVGGSGGILPRKFLKFSVLGNDQTVSGNHSENVFQFETAGDKVFRSHSVFAIVPLLMDESLWLKSKMYRLVLSIAIYNK